MEQYVQEDNLFLPTLLDMDIPCSEQRPKNPPEIRSSARENDPPIPPTSCSIIQAEHDAFNSAILAHSSDPAYTQYMPLYNRKLSAGAGPPYNSCEW